MLGTGRIYLIVHGRVSSSTCDSRGTRFRSLLGPVPVSSVLLSVGLLLLFVWMALRSLVSWLFRVGGTAGLFATVDLCRSFVGILDFHLRRIGIAGTLVSPPVVSSRW
jgi:hypothetical protein